MKLDWESSLMELDCCGVVREVGNDGNMIYLCSIISSQKQISEKKKILTLQNDKENAALLIASWQAKRFRLDNSN